MFNKLSPLLFVLGLAALLPAQSTWYVPDHFATIQAGIDGSSNGDTVIVRDGIYFENINFNGREITLMSENGPSQTEINGIGASDSVVKFIDTTYSPATLLSGFSITFGAGYDLHSQRWGGGITMRLGASPMIRDCIISNNTAKHGGAVHLYKSNPPLI